ncbi:MAG TPA: hypothetical protein VMU06_00160 [Stellaceae bacterium]|nr:hypothetical protein [Stellaceae bacterium]
MTISAARLPSLPLLRPRGGAGLLRRNASVPWPLYAALGFFLVGVVLKACSLIPVG